MSVVWVMRAREEIWERVNAVGINALYADSRPSFLLPLFIKMVGGAWAWNYLYDVVLIRITSDKLLVSLLTTAAGPLTESNCQTSGVCSFQKRKYFWDAKERKVAHCRF